MAVVNNSGSLRLLLDTNIVIAHEDDNPADPHVNAADAALLVRRARDLGVELLTSSGTRRDFLAAPQPRRTRRQASLNKYYSQLPRAAEDPAVRAQFPAVLSDNDRADLEVLSTFASGAATALVTEDRRMRSRAAAARLSRAFSLDEAVDWLAALLDPVLTNAAAAHMPAALEINRRAQIFGTLRADYAGFDDWWRDKVVGERRPVIVVGDVADPSGVAVVKEESDPFGLGQRVLKVCIFKTLEGAGGSRRGELLLRAVVEYARERGHDILYLTAWPHHRQLLGWLKRFGFIEDQVAANGELVMVKRLDPPPGTVPLPPLNHNISYGPQSVSVDRAFVVPIQDRFHTRLLPDSDDQLTFMDNEPCGNAIRKAYLCHANIRHLSPGDTLLFLRTGAGASQMTTVGVVEKTRVSHDPAAIAVFVAGRTVYRLSEIRQMCETEVLSILFRLDRRIRPPWRSPDLTTAGVMQRPPQAISQVGEEGIEWVRNKLQ